MEFGHNATFRKMMRFLFFFRKTAKAKPITSVVSCRQQLPSHVSDIRCHLPNRKRLRTFLRSLTIPSDTQRLVLRYVSAKLHYTDIGYTDMLYNTTNGHHQRTSSQQVVDVVQHVRSRLNLLYNILPATEWTCCSTTPTDELTTILQLVVQQIHHQRTNICHIPTSWHVEMLGSGIAKWQICCRIVVSSSVGGVVQHVRCRCPRSGVWHLRNVTLPCVSLEIGLKWRQLWLVHGGRFMVSVVLVVPAIYYADTLLILRGNGPRLTSSRLY